MRVDFVDCMIGLAGLAWAVAWLRWASPLAMVLAVLAAGSCLGSEFWHWNAWPIPVTLDRVLWLCMLGHLAAHRQRGDFGPRGAHPTDLAAAALVGVVCVSTLTHDWSAHGDRSAGLCAFFYIMPLGMYLAGRGLRWSPRQERILLASIALFSTYLAVTALAEYQGWWWMVWPKFIRFSPLTEFLGRGRGPFLNPVANGMVITTGWMAGWLLWRNAPRIGLVTLALWSGLIVAGLVCTFTRSVWLAAAISAAMISWRLLPRTWRPLLISLGAAIALVVPLGWDQIKAMKRDAALSAAQAEESIALRPILARIAWNMFVDRPWTGCGFGHYLEEKTDYLFDPSSNLPLAKGKWYIQHNVFLSLLTETGISGLLPLIALLVLAARDAWILGRHADPGRGSDAIGLLTRVVLVNYTAHGMFHDVSVIAMVHMLLFFFLGLSANLAAEALRTKSLASATSRALALGPVLAR